MRRKLFHSSVEIWFSKSRTEKALWKCSYSISIFQNPSILNTDGRACSLGQHWHKNIKIVKGWFLRMFKTELKFSREILLHHSKELLAVIKATNGFNTSRGGCLWSGQILHPCSGSIDPAILRRFVFGFMLLTLVQGWLGGQLMISREKSNAQKNIRHLLVWLRWFIQ